MYCMNKPCAFAGVCKVNGVDHADEMSITVVAIFIRGAGVSGSYIVYLRGNLETVVHEHQDSQGFSKCFASP